MRWPIKKLRPKSSREQQALQKKREAEEHAQQAQSYVSQISTKIEQNWSRPPSARKGMRYELLLQLVPIVFERYFRQLRLVFNPQDLRL